MIVFIFIFVAVLLYCLWLPTVRRGLKGLSCKRAFSVPAVFQGQEGELIETVRNSSSCMIPWLRIESRISPYLRLGKQSNLHVAGEMYYCSVFTLMPYQQIRRTHKVRFTHRGVFNLGNASLTAGDFLGLFSSQRSQNLSAQILVYPQLLTDEQIPSLMSRQLGDLSRRRQLLEDPFLVRGIRPYVPGDPVRDIHWPATARVGETQVRVHDYTTRTRLLVVLNVQSEELQWQDTLEQKHEPLMEYAISLAATLCTKALRDGLSAGFATNMSVQSSNAPVLMLPADGAARTEEMLAMFARLELVRRQYFPVFLESLNHCTGLDILVLSMYDSGAIQQQIQQLRLRGNQVTMHLLEGGAK